MQIPAQEGERPAGRDLLDQFYASAIPTRPRGRNLIRFTLRHQQRTRCSSRPARGTWTRSAAIVERLDTSEPIAQNELRIYPAAERAGGGPGRDPANGPDAEHPAAGDRRRAARTGAAGGLPAAAVRRRQQPGRRRQPGGQQPFGQAALGQATAGIGASSGRPATNTTKTVSLRFLVPGKDGTFESGYLEDVHITPDVRSNSLIISAPKKTLDLLQAVITSLDSAERRPGPGEHLHAEARRRRP